MSQIPKTQMLLRIRTWKALHCLSLFQSLGHLILEETYFQASLYNHEDEKLP